MRGQQGTADYVTSIDQCGRLRIGAGSEGRTRRTRCRFDRHALEVDVRIIGILLGLGLAAFVAVAWRRGRP